MLQAVIRRRGWFRVLIGHSLKVFSILVNPCRLLVF